MEGGQRKATKGGRWREREADSDGGREADGGRGRQIGDKGNCYLKYEHILCSVWLISQLIKVVMVE
jgi:hypothetical protein